MSLKTDEQTQKLSNWTIVNSEGISTTVYFTSTTTQLDVVLPKKIEMVKIEIEANDSMVDVIINSTTQQEDEVFDIENPTFEQLWLEKSKDLTVIAEKNNSDNVSITVKVVDNAGNEEQQTIKLSINIDKPTSTITFNDSENKMVDGYGYYGHNRTIRVD